MAIFEFFDFREFVGAWNTIPLFISVDGELGIGETIIGLMTS